jgi:hypothetical protein
MQVSSEMGSVVRVFAENVGKARVTSDFLIKSTREIPLVARLDEPYYAMAVWTRPQSPRRDT